MYPQLFYPIFSRHRVIAPNNMTGSEWAGFAGNGLTKASAPSDLQISILCKEDL
jgi:hypothetical protein